MSIKNLFIVNDEKSNDKPKKTAEEFSAKFPITPPDSGVPNLFHLGFSILGLR